MTTDLAALSAAATQGEWQVAAWYHNSGTPDELCGGLIEADDSPTGVIDENWMQDSESLSRDLDFIVALVNAYRAGNLVQIDREGVRERVAKAICRNDPEVRMGDAEGVVEQRVQHEWVDYVDFADAAIAAMMGGAK